MRITHIKADEKWLYHRVIIKLGTNLITAGTDRLDLEIMASLVTQVAQLHQQGIEVVIVSSGAIAAGRQKLRLVKERKDIPFRQMLAAVGQSSLMNAYDHLFAWQGITIAQALLTRADMSSRAGYLNARNTLLALMESQVVPIVNENDVIATDEIKEEQFGDNDSLSAQVANLVDADLLILLSDVGGLYNDDPHLNRRAKLIPNVDCIDRDIESFAKQSFCQQGTGGMATKLEAARLATNSGVPTVLAHGQDQSVVLRLVRGESVGTFFSAGTTKLESRKRWMLSGLVCQGKIIVDEGAVKALKIDKGSLLSIGIVGVEQEFQRGDIVEIIDSYRKIVARGIANYRSVDIAIVKGCHSEEIFPKLGYQYSAEIVHRNNLVVV